MDISRRQFISFSLLLASVTSCSKKTDVCLSLKDKIMARILDYSKVHISSVTGVTDLRFADFSDTLDKLLVKSETFDGEDDDQMAGLLSEMIFEDVRDNSYMVFSGIMVTKTEAFVMLISTLSFDSLGISKRCVK